MQVYNDADVLEKILKDKRKELGPSPEETVGSPKLKLSMFGHAKVLFSDFVFKKGSASTNYFEHTSTFSTSPTVQPIVGFIVFVVKCALLLKSFAH